MSQSLQAIHRIPLEARKQARDASLAGGYFDRILRDNDPTEGVIRYILENPVRAGLVDDVREYPLIGAAKYDIDDLLLTAMLWRPKWKCY
jgi:hypothetical protein